MKNKYLLSGLFTIGAIALVALPAFAYQGDYTVKGPNHTEEREAQMQEIFANNDYNTWKELMGDRGRVTEVINEDNFAKFAEAYRLAQEGRYDEADAIREELGLRTRNSGPLGLGRGYGRGNGDGSGEHRGQGRGQGLRDGSCLNEQ